MIYTLRRDEERLSIEALDDDAARSSACLILRIAGYVIKPSIDPAWPNAIPVYSGEPFWLDAPLPEPSCEAGTCRHQMCARERVKLKRAAAKGAS